jgi:stage II sporulation protein D
MTTFQIKGNPGAVRKCNSTASGSIKKIRIGDMIFDGEDVRSLLGLFFNKIYLESIRPFHSNDGLGNGLGLCQYGARGMALLGFPVDEILKFYFTGVELKAGGKTHLFKTSHR